MQETERQLRFLADHGIACVIIGVAATLHGSSLLTEDLDLCYERSWENLNRLAEALCAIGAKLRGAPDALPFLLDAETLRRGMNFTFITDIGLIDLLGEVAGVGGYTEALETSMPIELFGFAFQVLSIEKLIAAKRAAGRAKDLAGLPELEAIAEQQRRS